MIQIFLEKAVPGRVFADAMEKEARNLKWKIIKKGFLSGLAPGSVKRVDLVNVLEMSIPLGERQTRFHHIKEHLEVGIGQIPQNDIREINLLVGIKREYTKKFIPKSAWLRQILGWLCTIGGMTITMIPAAMIPTALKTSRISSLMIIVIGLFIFAVGLALTLTDIKSNDREPISLDSPRYKDVEEQLKQLLSKTFQQLKLT